MGFLTDRVQASSSAMTGSTLVHVVDTNDFSQNPAGSSYKASFNQLNEFFSLFYVDVTGDTITGDLIVTGNTSTSTLLISSGATTGYILTSIDNLGNSSWQPLSSLSGSSVISVTGVTTSAYTATTSYSYYGVEYSGNTGIEIPDAAGLDGFMFRIKDERGTSSTYPITITPAVGNIDGNPFAVMAINYMSLTLVARNNNWWII